MVQRHMCSKKKTIDRIIKLDKNRKIHVGVKNNQPSGSKTPSTTLYGVHVCVYINVQLHFVVKTFSRSKRKLSQAANSKIM